MKRMDLIKIGRSSSYRVQCWCCHNNVDIPDSGHCPVCGAVN